MDRSVAMILAGGVGSRLSVLSQARAKPAVPFGGIYRIIDFTLSNVVNSGINYVGVLTQYRPDSLMTHLQNGEAWGLMGRTRALKILPPSTGKKFSDWYKGTADAVRQNMDFIHSYEHCDTVLILSGDHIYNMDYAKLIQYHRSKKSDITIAALQVPISEASEFGIIQIDDDKRIIGWEEKPQQPKSNLASMGIYVFSLSYLNQIFDENAGDDFGKHLIPYAMETAQTFVYPFDGFWRDVGTLNAYWQSNMDILNSKIPIDPQRWNIYTAMNEGARVGDRPPSYVGRRAEMTNSMISQGCIIEGKVINSVLSPGVWVQKNAVIRNSVVMNNCEIGEGSIVDKAILDKEVIVGNGVKVGVRSDPCVHHNNIKMLEGGLTLIAKGVKISDRSTIEQYSIIGTDYKEAFPTNQIGRRISSFAVS